MTIATKLFTSTVFIFIVCNIFLPSGWNGGDFAPSINLRDLYDNFRFFDAVQNRAADPVFAKRPLLINGLKFINDYTGIPYQTAWNLINVFCIAIILKKFSQMAAFFGIQKSIQWSGIYFFSQFPVLFCVTTQLYGFDDFLQWALLLSGFTAVLKNKLWVSTLYFGLSIICRETSIFMLPFFLYPLGTERILRQLIFALLGVFTAILVLYFVGSNKAAYEFLINKRFSAFGNNFGNFSNSLLSIISVLQVFLPCYLLLYFGPRDVLKKNSILLYIFIFVSISFLIVATFSSLLRENRIIFLPILFILPLLGEQLRVVLKEYKKWAVIGLFNVLAISFLVIVFAWVSFALYQPSTFKSAIFYQVYTFIFLSTMSMVSYLFISNSYKPDNEEKIQVG